MNQVRSYRDRVKAWDSMVKYGLFETNRSTSASARRLMRQLLKSGDVRRIPVMDFGAPGSLKRSGQLYMPAPGVCDMPEPVDPVHHWQQRAWRALRWYSDGASPSTIAAVLGDVSPEQILRWMRLMAKAGWMARARAGKYRALRMKEPRPPHRHDLHKEVTK